MDVSSDILARVRRLTIRSRRMVAERMAGEFRSAFRGSGVEFDEVREYFPGDDVRAIDWNVTARLGRPFIKRFVEERERVILIATDLSYSMRFGTAGHEKRDTAAEVAALLSLSALFSHDRAGLVLFTDELERVLLPRGGSKHVLRVVREVLGYEPQGRATNLEGVLTKIDRILHRPTIVFLISDFEVPEEVEARDRLVDILTRMSRRHDVIPVWITDPRERELERSGVVRVRDAETNEVQWIDTDDATVRATYAAAFERWGEILGEMCRRARLPLVHVGTEEPAWGPLEAFFERRGGRHG